MIKTKEELNRTELDRKIRTILSKLNKNKRKLILLVFDEKKKIIGMEEIRVTHTVTVTYESHIVTFCRSVTHARYLCTRKFAFVRI